MKTILVTGGNRGIGLELVRQYYAQGFRVIACCRNPQKAEALSELSLSKKGELIIAKLDVTRMDDIKNLSLQLQGQEIDILINNAGISGPSNEDADALEADAWITTFHTNTFAPYFIAQSLLRQIEKSQLKLIANISSSYGSIQLNNRDDYVTYRASKAALNAATKCLAGQLKERGIKVVLIHPGSVRTDMGSSNSKMTPEECVIAMRGLLASFKPEISGSFVNYKGEILPW